MEKGTFVFLFSGMLAFSTCTPANPTGNSADGSTSDGDSDMATDSISDTDSDSDTSSDFDTDTVIPQTCQQAEQATTSVGCLFYSADLHLGGWNDKAFGVVVSNVNQIDDATVTVYKGNAETLGWDLQDMAVVLPMDIHVFELPDYHMYTSGIMPKGTYKIESDLPIVAYQFNPVEDNPFGSSASADASMLIPKASLSLSYDVVGWKQCCVPDGPCNGSDMRAYFVVVATEDGTIVDIDPAVAPLGGDGVPSDGGPFTVELDEGDLLEVETNAPYDSMTGSRIQANEGHPIVVFSGHEEAFIPEDRLAAEHLEEQMPGLRFWGTEFVAARMPVRSTNEDVEEALWQVYASEDGTQIELTASIEVIGLPDSPAYLNEGELLEFYVKGTHSYPGDFHLVADKPVAVMQYMVGGSMWHCDNIGDPAMVYTPPVEQFLPRYVLYVPNGWELNDVLIITRHAGVGVFLDGELLDDDNFIQLADLDYEIARISVDNGIHALRSEDVEYGVAVIVVGYEEWDSYAYVGGMGMAPINPIE